MIGTVEAGEDVRVFVEEGTVRERFPVSEAVAARLVERFGTADAVDEATRDELQQVKGIGPATAEEINPPTSDLLDEQHRAAEADGESLDEISFIPQYLDEDGVYRAPEEKDEHPPMPRDER